MHVTVLHKAFIHKSSQGVFKATEMK